MYIKTTSHKLLPLYVNLFNLIMDTGILPIKWSLGTIIPIYKNKGDPQAPENFRPITLLSCVSKLFTSVLNNRLNKFLEDNNILIENQAGFRKSYSTLDHIFTLNSIVEILRLRQQKKKLFCLFIDFSQAFDSVWRVGLWQKLLENNINGNFFNIVKNMYSNIKSCISLNGEKSPFFGCNCGVRQGENLSPVLFSLFLNDLEAFLVNRGNSGIDLPHTENEAELFLKILILLYADETVLLAEDPIKLQNSLNDFVQYCDTWNLNINISKTKVLIFGTRVDRNYSFKIGDTALEIVKSYKYLGTFFAKSGSFLTTRKHLAQQARKALHLLLDVFTI